MAALAAEPDGYYSSCEGKSGKALLQQLQAVVGQHTTVSYKSLPELYRTTDVRPNGTVWDMYSTKEFSFSNTCGNYKSVGDCWNREHSFPKSWFNDKTPMYSDAYHVYPTDGKVNGQRSNLPYGECAGGTYEAGSGSVRALGRKGTSTFPGYTGTVFEPDDQYKGDFARSYFYMAAAYNSQIGSWSSPMLAGNAYPAFSQWAIDLLLKWHRQDPVSQKELDRNEAVAEAQHNRNPFIDHPDLAEHIWGNKSTEAWKATGSVEPAIILPVAGYTAAVGTTIVGVERTAKVTVKAANIEQNITLAVSGAGFAVSPTTVSRSQAQGADGYDVTITFTPSAAGNYTGTLTLKSGALSRTVTLSGSAVTTLPAGPVTGLSDHSFAATWSYVGDTDCNGEYMLNVCLDGESLDEYPMMIKATDEYFVVEDLMPSTTYTYTVSSENYSSETVTVTTLAPKPAIDILFDGEPDFSAPVGEPSEVAEFLIDSENLGDEQITLAVPTPFQLSIDKAEWATTLELRPDEDRFYVRMLAFEAGSYRGAITATAGDYSTDDATISGTAYASVTFFEDFEADATGCSTYNGCTFRGSAAVWNFNNVGIWPKSDRVLSGTQSARFGKNADSSIEMAEDFEPGFGTVTLNAIVFNNDPEVTFHIESSTDQGRTWQSAGMVTHSAKNFEKYTFAVNCPGPARLRVRQTAGSRFNIDDIEASRYTTLVPDEVAEYHTWDAYARGGQLIIEASEPVVARIYAIDGTTLYAGAVAGQRQFPLPAGLYIVAVDDFARRVLVR